MDARRLTAVSALTIAAAVAALAPAAQGRTLGSALPPNGAAEPSTCFSGPGTVMLQKTGASPSWTAPAGGTLTSWSMYARGVPAGSVARLVVMRGATVAAIESGTVDTVNAEGVAVFTPAVPLVLQSGDRIGLAGDSVAYCYFNEAGADQTLTVLGTRVPPLAPGQALEQLGEDSPPSYQLNLAAEVNEAVDLRVSAAAGPANALAGQLAQLSATVTNAGGGAAPVTVTTTVPAGLPVTGAVAGGGSCAVAGQAVTCTIPALAVGASAPVVVLVAPAAAGAYPVSFNAAGTGATESTPADNTAAATLTVANLPAPPVVTPRCVVPSLAGTPLGVVRSLLPQLRCQLGRVTKASSRRVAKGAVISTKPGRGEYGAGSAIAVVVSSGKPVRRPSRRPSRRAARRGARRTGRR